MQKTMLARSVGENHQPGVGAGHAREQKSAVQALFWFQSIKTA
jgi:hypothetical protein